MGGGEQRAPTDQQQQQQTTSKHSSSRSAETDQGDSIKREHNSEQDANNNKTMTITSGGKLLAATDMSTIEQQQQRQDGSTSNNSCELSPASLAENHESTTMTQDNANKKIEHNCAKCRQPIKDKFIFSVLELSYHANCLKCADCSVHMDQKCFVSPSNERQLFCRSHFYRRFGPRCFDCREPIQAGQLVQEVKLRQLSQLYHQTCFTCSQCKRRLLAGEQLHLLENGKRRLCQHDFQSLNKQPAQFTSQNKLTQNKSGSPTTTTYHTLVSSKSATGDSPVIKRQRRQRKNQEASSLESLASMIKAGDEELELDELDEDELEAEDEEEDELDDELDDEREDELEQRLMANQQPGQRRVLAQRQGQLDNDANRSSSSSNSSSAHMQSTQQDGTQQAATTTTNNNHTSSSTLAPDNNQDERNQDKQAARNQRRRRRRRERSLKLASEHHSSSELVLEPSASLLLNGGDSSSQFATSQQLDAAPTTLHLGGLNPTTGASSVVYDATLQNPHLPMTQQLQQFQHNNKSPPSSNLQQHNHLEAASKHQHSKQPSSGGGGGGQKPTRVRTVLNEKQLETLRRCYASNPRPDALTKDQLVSVTGLSARVIRVWFQNKRCKDKKKNILSKKMGDDEEVHRVCLMGGVGPMVAASPSIHYDDGQSSADSNSPTPTLDTSQATQEAQQQQQQELPSQGHAYHQAHHQQHQNQHQQQPLLQMQTNPNGTNGAPKAVDIHAYAPPWQSLAEYALQQQHQANQQQQHEQLSPATPSQQQQQLGAGPFASQSPASREQRLMHSPPASPRFQQIIGQIHGYNQAGAMQQASEQHLLHLAHYQQQQPPAHLSQQHPFASQQQQQQMPTSQVNPASQQQQQQMQSGQQQQQLQMHQT